jgi:hypothetical protein
VPFTVNLLEADGVPIEVVKFPRLDTDVEVRGGVEIWRSNGEAVLLPALFLAKRFTEKLPPAMGVPEISPVVEFRLSPLGKEPLRRKERLGGFVAVIW